MEKRFIGAYEEFSDAIFRYCYFKLGDRELSKDFVQDVFLKTWSYLEKGNDIENFRAFLYRLARNIVIDWYRKNKTFSLDKLRENGFDPVDQNAKTEVYAEKEEAINLIKKLGPQEQELITLRYIEELSLQEIASILNKKENNVSVMLHRAIKHLRSLLKE